MKNIPWSSLLHHVLTVLALILMPVCWLALNCYGGRTGFVKIFRAWNETRVSGEPWGWFDRNYSP